MVLIPACQEINPKPHSFTEGQIIDLTNLMENAHGLLLDQADQMEQSYAEVTAIYNMLLYGICKSIDSLVHFQFLW